MRIYWFHRPGQRDQGALVKPNIAIAAAFVLLTAADARAAPTILKGPYAQDVRDDAVSVVWQTSEAAAVTLGFGYTPAADDGSVTTPAGTVHEVRLSNLEKGRAVYYAIEGAEARANPYAAGGYNSLAGMVTLPPATGAFRFVVLGDTRSGHDAHAAIATLVAAERPAFVVNTGDLVADGLVETGWQTFFDIEHDLMVSTVLYPALGNHDAENGKADLYFQYFAPPKNDERTEAYYAFRYGSVFFAVLDSEVATYLGGFTDAQKAWIGTTLSQAAHDREISHRFVAIHQGPYPSNPDRSGFAPMRALLPVFKDGAVAAIFSGHDHNYERGTSDNGIAYVITGGGGAGLYDVGPTGPAAWPAHTVATNAKAYNYVTVDVDGARAVFTAKDDTGTAIDSWEQTAAPVDECAAPADCGTYAHPHDACAGTWTCEAGGCVWTCTGPAADAGMSGDAGIIADASSTNGAAPATTEAAGGCGCTTLSL